ncbi:MAG: histidinol dehydrogenase [Planctomycetaceae bacterium]|jgi:histidinol dehydrogenase|nr:histidinol dehydrogenase [Planctomycetaceae bacterium]
MKIHRIDSSNGEAFVRREISVLRERLSSRGDIVSESGRQRTIEIFGEALSPQQVVERICCDVRAGGFESLVDYLRRVDGVELTAKTIRVTQNELAAAYRKADSSFLESIRFARNNIRTFQEKILHNKNVFLKMGGGYICERYRPLRRVGVCVPGGAAAYPSTILMTVIPAQVAGVGEVAVMMPPTKLGAYNIDMLATCFELGVSEVYRMGGAQGVAAFAYGVDGIPAVDKIVGPGNMFVSLAKRFVNGDVGIDMIAGPSELVVLVDGTTDPVFVAYDILAQAEHSPGVCIIVGWDKEIVDASVKAIESELSKIERGELARVSLERFGALIVAKDELDACRITDLIAPEHLIIATQNAEELSDKILNAGAIFIGSYAPAAVGDYAAGPSHVLPTNGTARFANGLTCNDFLKSSSVMSFSKKSLAMYANCVETLANKEGLTAHAESIEIRLN